MFRTFKNFLKNRITIFQYLPGSFNFFFCMKKINTFKNLKRDAMWLTGSHSWIPINKSLLHINVDWILKTFIAFFYIQ